jgi:hypothetical protein
MPPQRAHACILPRAVAAKSCGKAYLALLHAGRHRMSPVTAWLPLSRGSTSCTTLLARPCPAR